VPRFISFDARRRRPLLPLVIVFAKAPRPGFVKTRLGLEPTAAALLYSKFVRRTVQTVKRLHGEATVELSVNMECADWSEFPIPRTVQPDGDLGVRLYAALQRGLSAGHPSVTILGSDSPTLTVEHVKWLVNSSADVSLGPTMDGGYYGIACRKIHPRMFDGIRWSTSDALQDTILAVEHCGLTRALGPEWFDVDRPEDLQRLIEQGFA
jgi:rSAM/selenodomain-associated transferase 1